MKAIFARVRSEFGFWGTRLNVLAMLGATYVASNGHAVENAINSVVPEKWRPLAILGIGMGAFLTVNAAAQSDRKKAAGNG